MKFEIITNKNCVKETNSMLNVCIQDTTHHVKHGIILDKFIVYHACKVYICCIKQAITSSWKLDLDLAF